ncbi:Crp/Fnr family transcriptional regulator [Thalassospira lucentensis]|uniref:Crp/Fnr family transcriptional regulator n=1 Tax=Thalassospira lucentensis TaxID=168935 RepID=A0A358HR93_9PROT|nr:Crp/Fnr family transcriptional regulator [Thalassospira lucentensis]HBU97709.1 Crp/Fnr family transcriptional regulator [Thalassospira lucentensis]HCW67942.1 Crp/Fnr family transcriptional regulator [Thalassospira lucentensis]|tara:strand:+ start:2855 stop:3598 length:744 start_codon:yes stop_codon:yes gene_type:complete
MISSTEAVFKKLRCYIDLNQNEWAMLTALPQKLVELEPGHEIVHEGQRKHNAFILLEGWVASYKLLPDGARQIIDFQIPGDFLGLRSLLLRTSDHSFEAITNVKVAEVSAKHIFAAFEKAPRLAAAVLWAASRDEAMVVEHLINIGRRSAITRTAHFLLELGARLRLIGVGSDKGYPCPLSQYLLADALGLSAIHINRVLRQLREKGLLTFQKKHVRFDDFEKLVELADFQMAYLDQEGPLMPQAEG